MNWTWPQCNVLCLCTDRQQQLDPIITHVCPWGHRSPILCGLVPGYVCICVVCYQRWAPQVKPRPLIINVPLASVTHAVYWNTPALAVPPDISYGYQYLNLSSSLAKVEQPVEISHIVIFTGVLQTSVEDGTVHSKFFWSRQLCPRSHLTESYSVLTLRRTRVLSLSLAFVRCPCSLLTLHHLNLFFL